MHNNTPLPPDDPFNDFIQHDLDLDRMPDAEHDLWNESAELDEDTEAELSSPPFRRFASPSRRASAPSPVTLPPLTDPRWRRGVYSASQTVAAHHQPHPLSGVVFFLPASPKAPRPPLHYLPDAVSGWTAVRVSSGTGFVPSNTIRFEPYRWWREHFGALLDLLLLVLFIAVWLMSQVEHQHTVNNLNATISAQQTQIAGLQATLAAEPHSQP